MNDSVKPSSLSDPAAAGGALQALVARASELGGGAAPVETWDPPDCGPIPMRIAADGAWHYNGSPILRPRLVRLFASILRREADGSFVLVTPVEKVTIEVDDAPFAGVELVASDGNITVRTTVGDVVAAGPAHPFRFGLEAGTDGLLPYVMVRRGLEARLTRAAALELVTLAEERDGAFGVASGGAFFPLPATE